jgi:undecaprenyl-diphosphatase
LVRFAAHRSVFIANALLRWAVLFAGVAVFSHLALELQVRGGHGFDKPVQAWLAQRQSPLLTEAMAAVTRLGAGEFLALVSVVAALVFWLAKHPRSAIYMAVVAAGVAAMNAGLKLLFARERPEEILRLADTSGYSFPSGHAMAGAGIYGALAVVLFTRYRKLKWPSLGLCALLVGAVGLSRAYLHVHYPSDVIAGWGLGLTWPLWLKPVILGKHPLREEVRGRRRWFERIKPPPLPPEMPRDMR